MDDSSITTAHSKGGAWRLRPDGYEHNFIDGRTLVHHLHFYNPVTGGEHNIEVVLGCPTCPACKRPFERNELGLDPVAEIQKAIETLERNHAMLLDYARRYELPVRIGPLAELQGIQTTIIGDKQYLPLPRSAELTEGGR